MNCENCGAPLPMSSDGVASHECPFCQAGKARAVDAVALARTLERDLHDLHRFFEGLATTLEHAFPAHAVVERSGFFTKKVSAIRVTLDDYVFHVETEGAPPKAVRSRVVRGVTVKNESLPLQTWVNELSRSLAALAEDNAAAREALSRLR
jgi:hypothetical protein